MAENKDIYGIQIGLNVDALLFSPQVITEQEDIQTLKENVGNIAKRVRELLMEEFKRTEMDDIVVETMLVTYIDDDNVEDYIQVECI